MNTHASGAHSFGPDPAETPRLKEIRANLLDRMQESQGARWLGEVAAIEASLTAADRKLEAMSASAARHTVTHLGHTRPSRRRRTSRPTALLLDRGGGLQTPRTAPGQPSA